MIPPNSGIVEPTRLVPAPRRDRDGVFVGVPEHAADLLGREREHERIRRAGAAAERIAQVFRRNIFCEKQTVFI